jgi:hypothetical protein
MLDNTKKAQIRDFLIALAKKRSSTGYVKLNEKVKLGLNFSEEAQMNELYDVLDDISADSYKEEQLFLGILIVNKMRNRPSARFFQGIEKITGSKIQDTDAFSEQETEKLYDKYAPGLGFKRGF